MSTSPPIEFAMRTDAGRDPDKQVNEDAGGVKDTKLGWLAVVCDGMGGHEGGREASAIAVATILAEVESAPPFSNPQAVLRDAIVLANQKVRALGNPSRRARPGSTVVAALVHAHGVEIAHVGDSRIYQLRGTEVVQITRDHSAVQAMVDAGLLSQDAAKGHPEANKITRALGIVDEVMVDVRSEAIPYVAGDQLLLCSDGLCDLVEPADLLSVLTAAPPMQAAGQLVDLANARGGHDNITALVIRFRSTATPRRETQETSTVAHPGGAPLGEAHATEVRPHAGAEPATIPHGMAQVPMGGNHDARRQETLLMTPPMNAAVGPGGAPVARQGAAAVAPPPGTLRPGGTHIGAAVTAYADPVHSAPMSNGPIAGAPNSVGGAGSFGPDSQHSPPPKGFPWTVTLGLLGALVVLGALAFVLYNEIAERQGKHREPTSSSSVLPNVAVPSGVPSAAVAASVEPQTLVPSLDPATPKHANAAASGAHTPTTTSATAAPSASASAAAPMADPMGLTPLAGAAASAIRQRAGQLTVPSGMPPVPSAGTVPSSLPLPTLTPAQPGKD